MVYDTYTHEYFVFNDDKSSKEVTKENVEDFFDQIKSGALTAKGGSGVVHQIKNSIQYALVSWFTLVRLYMNNLCRSETRKSSEVCRSSLGHCHGLH